MRRLPVLIFASILSAPGAALACPTFPTSVQSDLGLAYTPPCTICHTTAVGNASSATEPFAVDLIMLGVSVSCDPTALASALQQMETKKTAVDMTGTPATTLLQEGCDPNTDAQIGASSVDGGACPGASGDGGMAVDLPPTVGFGCGAQIARGPAAWQGAAAIAAVAGLALARRRRPARR